MLLAAATLGCRPKQADGDAGADEGARRPTPPKPDDEPVQFSYPGLRSSFVGVAEEIERGVVAIRSTGKVVGGPAEDVAGIDDPYALGSGFLTDTEGFILTNDHVIATAKEIRVVLSDGTEHAATVAGRDPKLDVALLKIDANPRQLHPLELGDSERTRVGEWVVAAGNPFGLGLTVSTGIVSALRDGAVGPKNELHRAYLQTDADVHSGNSGGPMVNMQGQVIGINVAIENRAGIGYAIPIHRVAQILPQLKDEGKVSRAWLGAYVKPVTPDVARALGLEQPTGAYVTGVYANGPADRADIRAKDIILEYNGVKVSAKNLPWVVASAGVGREVKVVLWRGNGEVHLDLVTEKMPE